MSTSQFNRQSRLEGLIESLDSAFGLSDACGLYINTKVMACVGELGEGILVIESLGFSFVFKDSTPVSIEHGRDTITSQDLKENIVIAIQGFLSIKIGPNHSASRIINIEMKMPYMTRNPFERRGVHLNHLTEVFAS